MVAALTTFTAGGGPFIGTVTKHPWAKIKVAIDWGPVLTLAGSTIAVSTWVEPGTSTVVFTDAGLLDGVTMIDVSVGRSGETAIVENRVTLNDGTADVFKIVAVIA